MITLQLNCDDTTPDGRQEILRKMSNAAREFYCAAASAGCHAFIEFTGLMNEFIKVCQEAEEQKIDWLHANVHGSIKLPFQPHHIAYLNEKLECIYGVKLEEVEKL